METSELPSHLYHYTTFEGLKGILESKSLWASHCRFLNDTSEILLFKDRLPWEINNLLLSSSPKTNEFFTYEHSKILVDMLYNPLGEIYLAAFCGKHHDNHAHENGLLSQWRGYGKDGGYAIIFDSRKLQLLIDNEREKSDYGSLNLIDVVYSDDEIKFEQQLKEPTANVAQFGAALYRHIIHQNKRPEPDKIMVGSFLACVTRYKHCSFKEENEIRIIAAPMVHNQDYKRLAAQESYRFRPEVIRKFRKKDDEQIPYIELFNNDDLILAIDKIIVGPHKDKQRRADLLEVMLRNTDIEIEVSDIPYIGR